MVDLGEWLDIKEAAERKSVSDTTIRNHIKKGSLPSVKCLATGRDGRMVVKTPHPSRRPRESFPSSPHDRA